MGGGGTSYANKHVLSLEDFRRVTMLLNASQHVAINMAISMKSHTQKKELKKISIN